MFRHRIPLTDNLREHPKFIVFTSHLLMLFKFCHICKADNPMIETFRRGTMVEVRTICHNQDCPKKEYTWKSQPEMISTRMPAANFLLCFAILLSGNSASKVLQMFKHMGLSCFSLRTYFTHQRVSQFFCSLFCCCFVCVCTCTIHECYKCLYFYEYFV